jgi:vacuolar-type H+-ATPase subunit H
MDILYLIDRLEEIIKDSKHLGGVRLINEERIWPLIDQMRISIPDEVRRAERIIREKERVLAQAHEEAERIVELARSESAKLAAEHNVTQAAEARATAIRERAQKEAGLIKSGADDYAFDVLCNLEQELKRALTVIENGIHSIQVERSESQLPGEEPAEDQSSSP